MNKIRIISKLTEAVRTYAHGEKRLIWLAKGIDDDGTKYDVIWNRTIDLKPDLFHFLVCGEDQGTYLSVGSHNLITSNGAVLEFEVNYEDH